MKYVRVYILEAHRNSLLLYARLRNYVKCCRSVKLYINPFRGSLSFPLPLHVNFMISSLYIACLLYIIYIIWSTTEIISWYNKLYSYSECISKGILGGKIFFFCEKNKQRPRINVFRYNAITFYFYMTLLFFIYTFLYINFILHIYNLEIVYGFKVNIIETYIGEPFK